MHEPAGCRLCRPGKRRCNEVTSGGVNQRGAQVTVAIEGLHQPGKVGQLVMRSRQVLKPVLDGLLTTAVEEAVLRSEPLLARYWGARRRLDTAGCRAVR